MNNSTNDTLFYRLGKALGQPLAWVLRKQRPVMTWLVAKGIPLKLAKLMLIATNLFVLAALLLIIVPTWVMAIVVVLTIIIYARGEIDPPPSKEPEWRMGLGGFGLYDQYDIRVDPGDNED